MVSLAELALTKRSGLVDSGLYGGPGGLGNDLIVRPVSGAVLYGNRNRWHVLL